MPVGVQRGGDVAVGSSGGASMQHQHRGLPIGKQEQEDDEEFEAYVTALYTVTAGYHESWDAAMNDYAEELTRDVGLEPFRYAAETGDVDAVMQRLSWLDAQDVLIIGTIPLLIQALERGGTSEATRMGLALDAAVAETPHAIAFLRQHGAELVSQIDGETRLALRNVLVQAYREGLSPAQAAPRIRQLIGLTDKQAGAVLRYWQSLELPQRQAAQLADEYAGQLLRHRVRVISETEWVRAASAGQHSAFLEARSRGLIPSTTRRRWVAIRDERLCPICSQLDGKTTSLIEPFQVGSIVVMYPPAHPLCRCGVLLT